MLSQDVCLHWVAVDPSLGKSGLFRSGQCPLCLAHRLPLHLPSPPPWGLCPGPSVSWTLPSPVLVCHILFFLKQYALKLLPENRCTGVLKPCTSENILHLYSYSISNLAGSRILHQNLFFFRILKVFMIVFQFALEQSRAGLIPDLLDVTVFLLEAWENFFSHWSSEISQLCALALFYFYPLCGALGGEFSLPALSSLLRDVAWITLMNLFSCVFSLSLSCLFSCWRNCLNTGLPGPFLKTSPPLFSYLFWRGRGADFLNSSNPAIGFLISTLPKIFLFFVSFYSIWFPYLFVCFWGYWW